MQLWDNPNKEKKRKKKEMKKILLSPLSPLASPAADGGGGGVGSSSANVYLCVFAANWRILTVIIVRLIITTIKVTVRQSSFHQTKVVDLIQCPSFCSTDKKLKQFLGFKEDS